MINTGLPWIDFDFDRQEDLRRSFSPRGPRRNEFTCALRQDKETNKAQRTLGLPNLLTKATNSNIHQISGTFRTTKEARLLTEFVRTASSWVGT